MNTASTKTLAWLLSKLSLLMLVSCLLLPVAKAEVMPDLYTSSWPVSDQSESARNRALSNAFAQVLVRASGHEKVLNASAIKASLRDAASYMRLYSYQKLNFEEQKIYRKPLLLKVSFDPSAVTRLLKNSGQPVWNNNRPAGTYWIAVDNNGARKIAADGQDGAAIAARKEANSRGLPIILPLMDLEDKSAISAADVWGKFQEPVNKASKRYGADYVVMGSVSQAASGWQGSWVADLGSDTMRFTTSGASSQQAVAKMVNRVADRLATKLAVVLSNQTQTNYLLLQGIDSMQAYAKAQSILSNLSMVSSVNAIEVKRGDVLFQLELQSATQYLVDALEVSGNLRRSSGDLSDFSSNAPSALIYSWRN
ncbi:DUF2066 domain-containing protein [Kangiella sp. TOML190]|uniref:DUF2066 domain-containing protein n=1 Tax=Kangiella sp. TOML190 TaxID=2931351 RepID=UPI00203B8D14|nr:DUF2066 domain-containing protein [Kangiella sp. TOML190]